MSYEISRMYASKAAADAAAAELKEEGFDEVHVVSLENVQGEAPGVGQIAGWIASGHVELAKARIYAEAVARGASLVTVHAPFGAGVAATGILESHGAMASGLPEPEPEAYWDEATPVSSAMHMPVLCSDPAPMSRFLGISPLASPYWSLSESLGLSLGTSGPMGDEKWGIPFLSNNPAPLSSMFGLPVLKSKKEANW